jgi:hypothetical protein
MAGPVAPDKLRRPPPAPTTDFVIWKTTFALSLCHGKVKLMLF